MSPALTHVRTLQADSRLEQLDELVKVPQGLIVLADLFQVIGIDDNIKSAKLGQPELLLVHARIAHLLPRLGGVGLAGRVDSFLEPVRDAYLLAARATYS